MQEDIKRQDFVESSSEWNGFEILTPPQLVKRLNNNSNVIASEAMHIRDIVLTLNNKWHELNFHFSAKTFPKEFREKIEWMNAHYESQLIRNLLKNIEGYCEDMRSQVNILERKTSERLDFLDVHHDLEENKNDRN